MSFSSTLFIFLFLPITMALYAIAYKSKKISCCNVVLICASAIFYAWGGIKSFAVLLMVILINYIITLLMERHSRFRKWMFILALFIDITNLLYFKYFNFFAENIAALANSLGYTIFQNIASVAMPIGISFYTFQIISYVADVYTRKILIERNPIKLALYIMMFPTINCGPILRYNNVSGSISSRVISTEEVEYGVKRFILGFSKKVFLANAMGDMADTVFTMTGEINTVYAWLGAICYTLQIYYDFSAYSDMAIGIGRMLGFHFTENFDLPYKSQSIQEFWRRWHISLSSWFRDYVYIPLGGNRKGIARTYFNLFFVFLLTGFWHGAAWQFIVWGIWHGLFSIVERLGLKKVLGKLPCIFRYIYTLLVVIIGWVFFRADNLTLAVQYIRNMFSLHITDFKNYEIVSQFTSIFWICLIIALVFSVTKTEIFNKNRLWNNKTFVRVRYLVLWIISVLYLTGLSYNPFIYFKF